MIAFAYVSAFVAVPWLVLVYLHAQLHGDLNYWQVSMSLFQAINFLICWWEQTLFINQKTVQAEFAGFKKKYGTNGQLPNPFILFQDISFAEAISMKRWATIWSTYSLMDDSYSDTKSFGFWIDTGNGFITFIPTALFWVGMTYTLMEARVLGVMGLVFNYQMWYGTVLYFSQYLYNHRYVGQPAVNKVTVFLANVIWMVFPSIGMWLSYDMIMTNSYDLVH